ncbi:Hypothetical predicted protein [Cloeon dipterum]|uniref:Uncharacterized protein n=1 Tax=Cloeon dipterum TaxID=197152 RepID=A0A8S1DEE8_9INSE|nr:Hypothetical predicted protein [Cloeon dipterum]
MSSNTKIRSAKELQNILRDSEEEVLAKIGLSHLLPGQSSISFALPFWMTTVTIQMKATTLLLTAIPFTTNILNILPCKRHCTKCIGGGLSANCLRPSLTWTSSWLSTFRRGHVRCTPVRVVPEEGRGAPIRPPKRLPLRVVRRLRTALLSRQGSRPTPTARRRPFERVEMLVLLPEKPNDVADDGLRGLEWQGGAQKVTKATSASSELSSAPGASTAEGRHAHGAAVAARTDIG